MIDLSNNKRNFGWSDSREHKLPGRTSTLDVKHLDDHAGHLHYQGYNKDITILKRYNDEKLLLLVLCGLFVSSMSCRRKPLDLNRLSSKKAAP